MRESADFLCMMGFRYIRRSDQERDIAFGSFFDDEMNRVITH